MQEKLLAGAMAGLMAGTLAACGGETPAPDAEKTPASAAADKGDQPTQYAGNGCAKQNACKGLGGCKVPGQNECKCKNPCKAKGGCHISAEEQKICAEALAKGEEPQLPGGAGHSCGGMK